MKHVAWIALHPSNATSVDPCSFCPRMARYSINIAHNMTETTYIASCADVRCVARLYLAYAGISTPDVHKAFVAFLSDDAYVCMELLSVDIGLLEKVQFFVGADYRPITELVKQCKAMEDKRDSYERLEGLAA